MTLQGPKLGSDPHPKAPHAAADQRLQHLRAALILPELGLLYGNTIGCMETQSTHKWQELQRMFRRGCHTTATQAGVVGKSRMPAVQKRHPVTLQRVRRAEKSSLREVPCLLAI